MIWVALYLWVGGACLWQTACERLKDPAPYSFVYLAWPLIPIGGALGVVFRAIISLGTPR